MSSAGVPSIRNREEMLYFILKFRERETNRQAEKEGEVNIKKEFISLLAVLKTLISQEENVLDLSNERGRNILINEYRAYILRVDKILFL